MVKLNVDGKTRIIRDNMIKYQTDTILECVYKKHFIYISKSADDDYYMEVMDETGSFAVQGGFGGEYCRDGIKTIEDCLVVAIQNILI